MKSLEQNWEGIPREFEGVKVVRDFMMVMMHGHDMKPWNTANIAPHSLTHRQNLHTGLDGSLNYYRLLRR